MSKTIDERVVSLQFDNSRFEKNVSTTMSTLDKLKSKLSFKGASKGLEDVNTAAKRVDMNGLGRSVEAVGTKFSALQVMGVTALANITNSAVNAGKRIASALTIDPVKTGLSEFETKMNAIQVIQANTRGKNTMDDITAALDDLNEYADKTIYNFAQMTSNVGKFTAQGFDVKEASNAVKGLANLAAASGASAEDMARATYQMSQAMGSSIKLMDWNSLRNANMATQDLKDTLIALAKTHGIAIDQMIEDEGTFEYTLQNGWLTGEMFTEAMNIYSGVYSDAELAAKGFTDSQIKNFKDLAKTAESAATEVKTFSQLWDVLKETAQSGWTQTWELIFGDFDTAKGMFTKMQVYLSNILNGWSEARNFVLEGILQFTNPWSKIMDRLEGAGLGKIKKVADTVNEVTEKLEHFQDIVNKVWRGDYGNSDTGRYELLEKAGYDHRVVQDLVNKGYQYKLTMEDVEESHKKFGLTMDKTAESTDSVTSAIANLTDKQLEKAGLTEEEIRLYRDVAKEAERTGVTFEELAKEMSEKDGRSLLMEGLANIGKSIVNVFKAMKEAWSEIFPPVSIARIYTLIKGFNEFTQKLKLTNDKTGELNETGKKFQRTFKGIFALVDIIATVVGGAFKVAFKFAQAILEHFDLNILDITANIGDALVAFRDWIDGCLDFSGVVEKIAPYIEKAASAIKEWINALKESDNIEIAKNFIIGFANGIKNSAGIVLSAIWEFGESLLTKLMDVLQEHSPSKATEEIGKNFVLGLFNGIKETISIVWDLIKTAGLKCIDIIKELDLGKLFAAALGVGMLVVAKKFADALSAFSAPLEGLGEMFEGIGGMFEGIEKNFKAAAWEKRSRILINFALAVGILAASMFILGKMDPEQLKRAGFAIGQLAIVVGIILGLAAILAKTDGDFIRVSLSMAGVSVALLALAGALKIISTINVDNAKPALQIMAAMMLGLVGILLAIKLFINPKTETDLRKVGAMMRKMAIALLLMVGVIKLASMLDVDDAKKGFKIVAALELLVIGLIAVSKLAGANASKAGGMILKISVALLLMIGVIKLASKMNRADLKKALPAIAMLELLVIGLIAVSKLAGTHASKAGTMMLKISIALLLMLGVIKIASKLKADELKKAVGVISIIGVLFMGLIAVSNLAGEHAAKAGTMLLMVSGALLILSGVIFILGELDPGGVKQGLAAISVLMICFAGLIAVTRLANIGEHMKGVMITMIVAIGLLVAAVVGLSFLDPKDLWSATGAISALLATFALLIAATHFAKNTKSMQNTLWQMLGIVAILTGIVVALSFVNPQSAIPNCVALALLMTSFAASIAILGMTGRISTTVSKQILPLLGVVAGLALIIGIMSALKVEGSISTAISLSVLLAAMAAALAILSLVPKGSMSAVGSMAVLALVVGELAIILGLMSYFNVEASISTVASLSTLLVVMTGVLVVLGIVGALSGTAMAGVGAMALLGLVIGELAIILGLMEQFNINPSIEVAEALSLLLVSMSASLVLLGVVGTLGPAAFIGIAALATLIAGIGGLVIAIGALVTEFPMLETFLDTGIPIIEKIGYALGSFFGNIIGGFTAGATAGLPEIGTHLSQFMTNATPFIEGVKMVDASVLAGVGVLSGCVIALTAADLIAGMAAFMQGGSSFATLGTELSMFMANAMPFIEGATLLNADMVNGVKALAETILILTAANVLEGLASWFGGESSLETFGQQLGPLGTYLNEFATNLNSFGEDKIATVTCAARAIKLMSEAAEGIPNSGGWLGKIIGENDIGTFGKQLPDLGTYLSQFATNLNGFSEDKIATVDCAARAIKLISDAAAGIPNEGGWLAKIVGGNDIETFGKKLPGLGTNLNAFATNLNGFSEDKIATVDCAARAIGAIATAAESIPNEGGWLAKLVGDNDIETFGKKLPSLGTNLKGFAYGVGSFDERHINSVNAAVKAIAAFSSLANCDLKSAQKNIGDFGDELPGLGKDIASFASEMSKVNASSVTSASTNLKTLANAIKNLEGVDKKAASNFSDAIKTLGKTALDAFVKTFTSEASKTSIKTATSDLMTKAKEGFESKLETLKKAVSTIVSSVASSIKSKTNYTTFYNAGSYLVDGFADGISENDYKAAAKAKAMAKAAAQAAEDELGIQSPSKVGYGIGGFFGLGFVNAISDYASVSYNASRDMAKSAHEGLNDAMNSASAEFGKALSEQPTIRPVVDLSAVRTGADAIGDMLDMGASIGMLSRVGAINAAINHRNQNGDNSDVVSELKKLGKKLDNVGSDTYTFGDFTYDDGSNVADAIKTLTRAAKMERRV